MLHRNILVAVLATLAIAGCTKKQDVKIEYRDRFVPVYVVPAPPTVTRPELLLNEQNKETVSDEEFARLYSATTAHINGYVEALEQIIAKYAELAAASSANINKLDQKLLTADQVNNDDTREDRTE